MHPIYAAGIQIIETVQLIANPVLDTFFIVITQMGGELFYLLALPLIYWSLSMELGFSVGIASLTTTWINVGMKQLLHQPRPFDLKPGLNRITEHGYGIPSGHAQGSATFWGYLFLRIRSAKMRIPAAALMLLIAFSRIYLGVHFPTDILGGWLLAALVLTLMILLKPAIDKLFRGEVTLPVIVLLNIVPVALVFIDPTRKTATMPAALIGLIDSFLLYRRFFTPEIRCGIAGRMARFFLGAVVLAGLYLGLKSVFPVEGESFYVIFRFLRYMIAGLWIGGGAPFLFEKIGLNKEKRA